jgi:hypothetical protein
MRGIVLLGALLMALVAAAPARAIVPPKNCGFMTVSGHRYNVKADQLRCRPARTNTRRYLEHHRKPAGYTCRDYTSGTSLKFRCSRGIKVFFAIKR